MSEHTKEPSGRYREDWGVLRGVFQIGRESSYIIEDAAGRVLFRLKDGVDRCIGDRLVACVNALAGVPTEDLTDVLAQRDALLEVVPKLANLAEAVGCCQGEWTPGHARLARDLAGEARAAVALAEPEKEPPETLAQKCK